MKSLALAKGLTIRKACEEDKETISQLVNQAFTGYNNGKNISHLKENLEDILRDIKKDEVIVLEGKNKIIGTLRLEYRDDNKYYLKKFAIYPKFQNQGLGQMLFAAAEMMVRAKNGRTIYLHSSREDNGLVNFYKKLGFNCLKVEKSMGYSRGLLIKELK